MRNFHEQQNFQLKTIINHANERVSIFEIQKLCFICSISHPKPNFLYHLCNRFESEHRLTHTKLRILHQRDLKKQLYNEL